MLSGPPVGLPTGDRESPGQAAAIILNWRTPELTIRAARALMTDGLAPDHVVVVDNGSGDGATIRAALPGCRIIELPANVGFARGNNIGAAATAADAYLFVNSDAFLHKRGSLAALRRTLERPEVGVVVPRLLNEDLTLQPSVRAFLRPAVAALAMTSLDRLVHDGARPRLGTRWSHGGTRRVECATGAVLLVDARVWRDIGGFDESRFMYGEDIDLQWRARQRGWATWFTDEAEFLHVGNASGRSVWDEEQRWCEMGTAEAALVRAQLPRSRARLTIGIMRSGLAARVVIYRLLRLRDRAATTRGLLRGFGTRPT